MALMQIAVVPLGGEGTSIGAYVAEIQKYLKEQKLPYGLHDMGTVVEGDVGQLLSLAKILHQMPFQKGIKRVYSVIVLDDRRDKKVSLGDKVKSVRKRLR